MQNTNVMYASNMSLLKKGLAAFCSLACLFALMVALPMTAQAATASSAEVTTLMTMYGGYNWSGDQANLTGTDGTCNATGYSFKSLPGTWNDDIESFRLHGNCDYVRAYENEKFGGRCTTYSGDSANVGAWWDDNISSLKITSVYVAC